MAAVPQMLTRFATRATMWRTQTNVSEKLQKHFLCLHGAKHNVVAVFRGTAGTLRFDVALHFPNLPNASATFRRGLAVCTQLLRR